VESIKVLLKTSRKTFADFFGELPLIHGAALAYYALLALIPLLYLGVSVFGQIVGHETMITFIKSLLHDYVGIEDVDGILSFLNDVDLGSGDVMLQTTGVIMVLFSCTAIVNSLRKSINKFYGIKKSKRTVKRMILKGVLFRLISMGSIVAVTVLLVAVYFAETIFLSLGNKFFEDLEILNWFFSTLTRHLIPIVTNVIIFSFIFKYLHHGVVLWRVAIRGAIGTGLLLYVGQLAIKFYLGHYFFASGSGLAGTLLMLLVWVYYSSLILFLGVKFTAEYARSIGEPIVARD
jgi:membrane protein